MHVDSNSKLLVVNLGGDVALTFGFIIDWSSIVDTLLFRNIKPLSGASIDALLTLISAF
jgi:hypothetical protein